VFAPLQCLSAKDLKSSCDFYMFAHCSFSATH